MTQVKRGVVTFSMTQKELQAKAYDIIKSIDIDKLVSGGLTNIELAYILSHVNNVVTIQANLKIGLDNSKK